MKLTRNDYHEGIKKIEEAVADGTSYLDKFEFDFPDGINTASSLEICKGLSGATSFEDDIRITKLCILKKTVEVKCPNGDVEKFCMSEISDTLDAFPVFQKEPLALKALSDCIHGFLLKKYLRLSTKTQTPQTESKKSEQVTQ